MQFLTELNVEGTTMVTATRSLAHAEFAGRIVNLLDGAVASERIRKAFRG